MSDVRVKIEKRPKWIVRGACGCTLMADTVSKIQALLDDHRVCPMKEKEVDEGITKHKTTTDVRHPYYEMRDNFAALKEAVKGDAVMRVDDELVLELEGIRAAVCSLHAHLEKTYIWD